MVPLKQFQRLLGHVASAAAVKPLGLLHMRPLQHYLHSRVPRWAWHHGTFRVNITQQCRRSLSPWVDLAFLWAGVPLEQVSRHTVVTTDASSTGWGATCNGQAASGLWTGPRLLWHINCLELWAVHLALRQFRPLSPSTRQTYALKLSLFANWCSSHREDPRKCTNGVVLSFLQERLERRLSPSTLKVYGPPRCSGRPVPGKA